jgi:hypothetical protein
MSEAVPAGFRPLSPRFDRALCFASGLHRDQWRKQSAIPYISHLMAVSAMVLEHGGDENQAIAALLHDGPEDRGGEATLERIRTEFGEDVASLVRDCTEPLALGKTEWQKRKDAYLAHLVGITPRAALIAGCDKVHNAQSLLVALDAEGERAFERFNGKARGTRWWFGRLAVELGPRLPASLERELIRCAGLIGRHPERAIWHGGGEIRVQTSPARFWSHDEMRHAESAVGPWTDLDRLHIDGPGPMFLYAFLGARAAREGVRTLSVTRIGHAPCLFTRESSDPGEPAAEGLRSERIDAGTVLVDAGQGRKYEAFEETAHRAAAEVRQGDEVILTGQMPMPVSAGIAFHSVARGARRILCVTPPDGMSMVAVFGSGLGRSEPMPEWLADRLVAHREARTFGIIGFPNAGKSVFAKLSGTALHGSGRRFWIFEADPASPTPDWFLELRRENAALADQLRNAYKVEWSDDLQAQVAQRLATARRFFDRILVDLPGGHMKHPSGPQPIPSGREELFRQVDRFIILRRPDRGDDERIWIDALARHGLADRVHAVLDSVDVEDRPRLELAGSRLRDGGVRGVVRGLRRELDHAGLERDIEFVQPFRTLLEANG